MASIADIANSFRQGQVSPIQRLAAGVQQGQQQANQNQLLQLQQQAGQRQQTQLETAQTQAEADVANKALGNQGFAAFMADDPKKFATAQAAGLIPQDVSFENRDQFISQSLASSLGPEKANKILNPQASTEITIKQDAGDKKFSELNAAAINDSIKSITDLGRDSAQTIDSLNKMEQLLETLDTGPFEETKFRAEKLSRSLGLPFQSDSFADKEQFQAEAAQQVLKIMADQKGPQTDQDRAFISTTRPGLGRSRAANEQMIDFAKSRQTVNRFYADKMREIRTITDSGQAINAFNAVQGQFEQTPAATVIDGKGITFNEFKKKAKAAGIEDDEIMLDWIEIAK